MASVRTRGNSARIQVRDLDDLATFVVTSIGTQSVTDLQIRIDTHRPPKGWVGSPGILGVHRQQIEQFGSGLRIRLTVDPERDISVLAAAALRMVSPIRGPQCTVTAPLPEHAATVAPAVRDVFANDVHEHLRRADLLFGEADGLAAVRITAQPDATWMVNGAAHRVWVDPAIHRPIGRRSVQDVVEIDAPSTSWLSQDDAVAMRDVTSVRGAVNDVVRAQLHACGVLTDRPASSSALALQAASVAARRQALREVTWPAALDAWPTVSAIMLTNRATYLDRICANLRALDYPRLQLVIGMHGDIADPAAIRDRLSGCDVEVLAIDGALPFGAAMQQASAAASGSLLTKIDDDDVYGRQHVWDLVLAKMYSGANVVGKPLDWIYLADEDVTVFRPVYDAERYAKFVAGGTIMIDAASLAEVGGWRPVPRSIDRALLESVRLAGGLVYRTHGLGYVYVRRASGHTAQADNGHFRTRVTEEFSGLIDHPEFS